MGLELVELYERVRIEQEFDPIARGHPARLALPFEAFLAAAELSLSRKLANFLQIFLKPHESKSPAKPHHTELQQADKRQIPYVPMGLKPPGSSGRAAPEVDHGNRRGGRRYETRAIRHSRPCG